MVTRARLDAELVRRGLARSRQQAAELIEQGRVAVRGVPAGKPATVVDRDTPVTVRETGERDWASRGAHKLIGALDAFGVDVAGARCLDAGASTGGFTDVLLDRGRRAGGGRRRRLRPAGVAAAQRRAGAGARPHQRARPHPGRHRRPGADHGGRPLVHLAAHGAARAGRLHRAGRRAAADGQAAVRGGPGAARRRRGGARPGAAAGRAHRGGGGGPRRSGWRCAARWPARCPGRPATSSSSCGSARGGADLGDAALRAAVAEGPQ